MFCIVCCQEAINAFKEQFGPAEEEAMAVEPPQKGPPAEGVLPCVSVLHVCALAFCCVSFAGGGEQIPGLLQSALLQMIGKPMQQWQHVNYAQLMKDASLFGLFPEKARHLCSMPGLALGVVRHTFRRFGLSILPCASWPR